MRIYCHTPTKDHPASQYRGFGIMSELNKSGDFRVEYWDDFDLMKAKGFGALYMQRPDQQSQCDVLMASQQMGLPVVIDYDDDLLDVPTHNRYYQIMSRGVPKYKQHIKFCLTYADRVIVSTDALREKYSEYSDNITVVRNAFDNYMYKPQGFNKTKTVIWRGGDSHKIDLETYREDLTALIVTNPDFQFIFMGVGFPSWLLECRAKNLTLKDPVYVYDFFNELKALRPSLMLVPLEDIEFNHHKSDCAKLEATMAGALCLSPDWDEWKWSNFTYKKDLYKPANQLLERIRNFDPKLIVEHAEAVGWINQYRTLKVLNRQRAEVFSGLMA